MASGDPCGRALQEWEKMSREKNARVGGLSGSSLEGFIGFVEAFLQAEDLKRQHLPTWTTAIHPLQIANTKLCNFGRPPLMANVEPVGMELMSFVASYVLADVLKIVLRLEALSDFWASELDGFEKTPELRDVVLDPICSVGYMYKAVAAMPFERGWLDGAASAKSKGWARPTRDDLDQLQKIIEDLLSR
jgi:hypothetical protein